MTEKRVIIAGGGVGGLATGLAFQQRGWSVRVLEQAPTIEEVGAGLQISPNGVKVLRALGLESEIAKYAFEPLALELRLGQSGHQIFRVPLGEATRKQWGAPYFHLHRSDLIEVLHNALTEVQSDAVRCNARVRNYEQDQLGVRVQLEDGTMEEGDLLIGADGIHSAVRTQMLGSDRPRFTGNVAWRLTVPADDFLSTLIPKTACVWAGPGRHAVTYYVRRGELINLVGVVERDDWHKESWTEEGTREDLMADFSGWHQSLRELIDRATIFHRWALFDRDHLPRWHDGRVALLGDACHPTLPFMAQGAVMALEDAYVLAALCEQSTSELPSALNQYFKKRHARTSRIQSRSRANMKVFHRRSPLQKLFGYGPMWIGGHLTPQIVRGRLDPFYAYDPTSIV